ncbi:MAG: hypothetical protein DHS20C21_11730 [Gemmatimonadota bacterium]|nr:MAG: hypothetical protein DHS20C21_11730 [Gemmatimonadota bacterium]
MVVSPSLAGMAGVQSAWTRHANASHNLANLNSEAFHSLHTVQTESASGLPEAHTVRAIAPGVDLAEEFTQQMMAQHQLEASIHVMRTQSEIIGTILDVFG